MNDWTIVLKACEEGMFDKYYNGLTIRFIVGACQIPIGQQFETPEKARIRTDQLFNEMKSYKKDSRVVTSSPCDGVKGYVMKVSEQKIE